MHKRRRYQRSREHLTNSADRISNLPIEIIHEIHSRLPHKDAARTSILSKEWRRIWESHPEIWLDERDFGADYTEYSVTDRDKRDAFLNYLTKFLQSRKRIYNGAVQKLLLQMTIEDSPTKKLVKKWIYFALENNITVLSLRLKTIYRNHYYMLGIAFYANTLVDLTISDCEITNCSFELPSLKFLRLFDVCIEDDDFKDLMAGCPRIEQLHVTDAEKLHTMNVLSSNPELKVFRVYLPFWEGKIRIESSKLNSLEFISLSIDLWEVEITSTTTVRELILRKAYDRDTLIHFINKFPLLEKLVIHGCNVLCEAEISPMPTVRSLTLYYVEEEDTSWMKFIDKFPLLENLIIADCSKLQKFHLSQPNLASLVLKDCMVEKEVRINSPKLKSFKFKGGITDFKGIEALQELEFVLLYFTPAILFHDWYSWLIRILKSCAHSKHLCLICDTEEVIIIPPERIDILPVNDIENLELEIISCHSTSEKFLDDFIWILPDLKTILFTFGSTSNFI